MNLYYNVPEISVVIEILVRDFVNNSFLIVGFACKQLFRDNIWTLFNSALEYILVDSQKTTNANHKVPC